MNKEKATDEDVNTYRGVIEFWFEEISSEQWWVKDEAFDTLITHKYLALHTKAIQGELVSWRGSELGALAEIIILDQFSRNIYRDKPNVFAYDAMALTLAQFAIASGKDLLVDREKRAFLYMPFMHSESRVIHEEAISLFKALANESTLTFEINHKKIIDRFGRYPHRNKILGRTSSLEEIAFLTEPNSSF